MALGDIVNNMDVEFKIRIAGEEDVETLSRFRLALQEHIENINIRILPLSQSARKSLLARYRQWIADPMRRVIFAKSKSGKLIGMAVALIMEQTDWYPPGVGRIDDFWVEKEYRRQGVARMLIGDLLCFFSKQSVPTIVLDYVYGNEEARLTWQSFGFKTILETAIISPSELQRQIGKSV